MPQKSTTERHVAMPDKANPNGKRFSTNPVQVDALPAAQHPDLLEDGCEEGVIRLCTQLEGCHKGGLLLEAEAAQLAGPLVQPLLLL